ncbi:MAG TPA: lysoplasmalogenase [Pyrinomonadaceae bacterium]|nr:lysoplasmalogenase [Pyrinomonadaceae bacterium]
MNVLSVLACVLAALAVGSELRGRRRAFYVFKPLTVVFIVALACVPKFPVTDFYRYAVVAGLVCSLAGDVFLMLPSDRFVQGLVCFLAAHVCYSAAFVAGGARVSYVWGVVPFAVYGGLMWAVLSPRLGKLKAPVAVYVLAILLMGWLALSRWATAGQAGSGLALAGACLFVASDSALALERFRGRFSGAQLVVLTTYFAAQWLIALST